MNHESWADKKKWLENSIPRNNEGCTQDIVRGGTPLPLLHKRFLRWGLSYLLYLFNWAKFSFTSGGNSRSLSDRRVFVRLTRLSECVPHEAIFALISKEYEPIKSGLFVVVRKNMNMIANHNQNCRNYTLNNQDTRIIQFPVNLRRLKIVYKVCQFIFKR